MAVPTAIVRPPPPPPPRLRHNDLADDERRRALLGLEDVPFLRRDSYDRADRFRGSTHRQKPSRPPTATAAWGTNNANASATAIPIDATTPLIVDPLLVHDCYCRVLSFLARVRGFPLRGGGTRGGATAACSIPTVLHCYCCTSANPPISLPAAVAGYTHAPLPLAVTSPTAAAAAAAAAHLSLGTSIITRPSMNDFGGVVAAAVVVVLKLPQLPLEVRPPGRHRFYETQALGDVHEGLHKRQLVLEVPSRGC